MNIIFTKDPEWLTKWDNYVQSEDRASHLLLSTWNNSFTAYGFNFEICICLNNDNIVGGYVAIIAQALILKFYIVPFGPIISAGYEAQLNQLIATVPTRAKYYNSCYCHITLPFSKIKNNHVINEIPKLSVLDNIKQGHLFKYVYCSNGLNWIDLKNKEENNLIDGFRPSVRRYIRSSERKNLNLKYLTLEKEIEIGYNLCLENAKKNNYSLRDWNSFKTTLISMIKNNEALFIAAFLENEIKGASLVIKSGNYLTYILGGTKKEKPDLLVGHFLHWQSIKLALNLGFDGYNISLGGSDGVVLLKNSYADKQVLFENSKYYWILKPYHFNLFLFLEKFIKKRKKNISKIISIFKK